MKKLCRVGHWPHQVCIFVGLIMRLVNAPTHPVGRRLIDELRHSHPNRQAVALHLRRLPLQT
jgi:hypothetical protein